MPGRIPGPIWVCPRCMTVVDYCCSCPGGWYSPAVPDDVEPLNFDTYEEAFAACDQMRADKQETLT